MLWTPAGVVNATVGAGRVRAWFRGTGTATYDARTMRARAIRYSAVAALVAGLVLRAGFVWKHPRFVGDTLVYGDLAHNLLAHHVYGLTEERIRPTLIRLPGYPLFLAISFLLFGTGQYVPVLWVQVGFDLGTCLLIADLARRVFGERAGLAALWLGALCPFTANYAAAALTETLSLFCVALGLWGLQRWQGAGATGWGAIGWRPMRWAAVVGLALVGAALLRPDGVLLAAAILPAMGWAAWRRGGRAWASAGLALGMLGGALGLWTARNWHVFHVVQPLAPKYANDPDEPAPLGFARWYRTWAIGYGDTVRVYWAYDGSVLTMEDLPPWAFDGAAQRAETARVYARYNDVSSATPEIEAAFARLAAERVRAHPVRYYVLLPMAKLADMWLRPRTELMKAPPLDWWKVRLHPRRSLFAMAYGALNVGLLVLAGVGWWRWWGWGGAGGLAFAAGAYVVLRSVMLLTIDNSEPRYTLECFPVVLLLTGVTFVAGSGARER